jgi:hypothetical protein
VQLKYLVVLAVTPAVVVVVLNGKAIPVRSWTGLESSRGLRFPVVVVVVVVKLLYHCS